MHTDDILYICVKLDDRSKNELKAFAKEVFGEDDGCRRYFCDHLTLAFGRECELFNMELVGTKVKLKIDTIAYDEKIAAAVVDREQVEHLGVNNKHPHITMVAFDYLTRPVYSNHMLELYEYETVSFPNDPIELTGEVSVIFKK
jgi:hypothetical protein